MGLRQTVDLCLPMLRSANSKADLEFVIDEIGLLIRKQAFFVRQETIQVKWHTQQHSVGLSLVLCKAEKSSTYIVLLLSLALCWTSTPDNALQF